MDSRPLAGDVSVKRKQVNMSYLFTSESVSKGHPDKVCDRISDSLLDAFLSADPESRVACETMAMTGLAVCSGEVTTRGCVRVDDVVRDAIKDIGYDRSEYGFDYKSCGVLSSIRPQSPDIAMGIDRGNDELQGAGDQGVMFGYACRETSAYMPVEWYLSNEILRAIDEVREEGVHMQYTRPDAKSQVTVRHADNGMPLRVDTVVVSVQHDDIWGDCLKMASDISADLVEHVFPRVMDRLRYPAVDILDEGIRLLVNPTGKFVTGGPAGDTGLTGRKIIVDTYGGVCPHGGGAFSGKDPSKVDRSGAYAARHIAKNLVAAGVCSRCCVQVAYAIGVAEPVGVYVNTYGTSRVDSTDGEIAEKIRDLFDLTPYGIIRRFGLKNPIYAPTAAYGHFGREPYLDFVEVNYGEDGDGRAVPDGDARCKKVCFFPWERLDFVDSVREEFGI